jgi:hypothetical protein
VLTQASVSASTTGILEEVGHDALPRRDSASQADDPHLLTPACHRELKSRNRTRGDPNCRSAGLDGVSTVLDRAAAVGRSFFVIIGEQTDGALQISTVASCTSTGGSHIARRGEAAASHIRGRAGGTQPLGASSWRWRRLAEACRSRGASAWVLQSGALPSRGTRGSSEVDVRVSKPSTRKILGPESDPLLQSVGWQSYDAKGCDGLRGRHYTGINKQYRL